MVEQSVLVGEVYVCSSTTVRQQPEPQREQGAEPAPLEEGYL